jgi:hypothetical protein
MLQIMRNTAFLIVFILSLTSQSVAIAKDYSVNITFDKVKPIETLALTRTIAVDFAPEKIDGLQVEVIKPLTGANYRQIVPSSRIRLLLNNQPFQLTNSPVTITFGDRIKTADLVNLSLELTVKPEDHADNYHGIITLKTRNNGSAGKTWKNIVVIQLAAEVEPWVKMRCETNRVLLDQADYTKTSLTNLQPLYLKIASNSNWILTCNLNADCELHPIVKIVTGKTNKLQVFNQNIEINAKRRDLAIGSATVTGGNYWLVLGIGVELTDIIKHNAQKYKIPLQFTLRSWDSKSTIP